MRRARRSEELEFLSDVDGVVRSAVAWRAHVAAVAAHLEPRDILLPAEPATLEAEVLRVEVRGLRLLLFDAGRIEEHFVAYEDLPIHLLGALAPGLVDADAPETHWRIGLLRLLRGAFDEARRAFGEARTISPLADLSVEERLLEIAASAARTA